ncbi:glycoside hydrolase family protein [Enterobacter kobei]|uniref:glycoside hydrolase family protein n=1 Tax=Enterobacter kobei TaxID=208224 RepID=UPI0018A5AD65|nr:hypothetical protein [Enterobacter kobei]BBW24589.1 hypothetical protein STN0717ENT53_P20470 [Enterobacter kobei]
MSSIETSNQGPGWNDHDTPYGTIHSYDGDNSSGGTGGNAGNGHDGIGDSAKIDIPTTKEYNGVLMSMCVNNLKKHEGFKNKMYKDTGGNITVGVGHLLATAEMAAALPFKKTATINQGHGNAEDIDKAVSAGDIKAAFNKYATDFSAIPNIHLTNDAVISECIKDVQITETGLRSLYTGYDAFSNDRKVALVDMGFNIGIPKLKSNFPNFNAAVNRGDWPTAAVESHRTGLDDSRNPRNKDTHDQLLSDK